MGQLLWILIFAAGTAPIDRDPPSAAIAIVSRVDGTAHRLGPEEGAAQRLELFDRLVPGTIVETGFESEIELVFRRGDRLVLEARGRAHVSSLGLQTIWGSTRILESVPPLLAIEPLWLSDSTPQRAGAVRIRRGDADGISPAHGEHVLPDAVELRFPPLGKGERYLLTLESEAGEVVLEIETRERSFDVPAGLLAGGEHYSWHVVTEVDARRIHRGGLFSTLDRAAAATRQELAARAESGEDVGLRLLLCEIDRSLNLASDFAKSSDCTKSGADADWAPEPGITLALSPETRW